MSTAGVIGIAVALGVVIVIVVAVGGSKWGRSRGYSGMGGDTIVRCSQGHLFTTLWVPGASLKSVRLGVKRYQRCPVCKKWRIVAPVADADLTEEDRHTAAEHPASRLP